MKISELLCEKYTSQTSDLYQYLQSDDFNVAEYWDTMAKVISDEYDILEELDIDDEDFMELMDANDYDGIEQYLQNINSDIFYNLPEHERKRAIRLLNQYLHVHDPAYVDARHYYVTDRSMKIIPRQTWLVHFSDQAEDIARHGFVIGMDRMDRLGLTRNMDDHPDQSGYNFAFVANSSYANNSAAKGKYGKDLVIFQNSGVKAYHKTDYEDQVIFHGPDVDPHTIIYVKRENGIFYVMPHPNNKPNTDVSNAVYSTNDYGKLIKWIIQNNQQYRNVVYGK